MKQRSPPEEGTDARKEGEEDEDEEEAEGPPSEQPRKAQHSASLSHSAGLSVARVQPFSLLLLFQHVCVYMYSCECVRSDWLQRRLFPPAPPEVGPEGRINQQVRSITLSILRKFEELITVQ
jgi:hypothetical protein